MYAFLCPLYIYKYLKTIQKYTSLPYFGVKLSCVCLMFADRKKAYSYLKVTNVTLM